MRKFTCYYRYIKRGDYMAKKNGKQSSSKLSKLASKVLRKKSSSKTSKSLAGSVLAQARKGRKKKK